MKLELRSIHGDTREIHYKGAYDQLEDSQRTHRRARGGAANAENDGGRVYGRGEGPGG